MKKSIFVEIVKNKGIYFITAYWNKSNEGLTDLLNSANVAEYKTPERFRILQNNTLSSLKFQKNDKSFSYLDLSGSDTSILQINGFTVVHTSYDYNQVNDCIYILNN